ncbi:Guanine nucleotide binding protein (G protein), beta polypeptide 1-like, partial [Chytridiales sp. JEL 0842]
YADGTLTIYSLRTKRPLFGPWKAHTKGNGGVLKLSYVRTIRRFPLERSESGTGHDAKLDDGEKERVEHSGRLLMSQGRDDRLCIWDVAALLYQQQRNDEGIAEKALVYTLPISSLNFCKFDVHLQGDASSDVIIAITNVMDSSKFDILNISKPQFLHRSLHPSQKASQDRASSSSPTPLFPQSDTKTGLCMALRFFRRLNKGEVEGRDQKWYVAAGFESGIVGVWDSEDGTWEDGGKMHAEPVMCMDISPAGDRIYTGAAEEKICMVDTRFKSPVALDGCKGVSDIRVRPDGKLVVVCCWDSTIRLLSSKLNLLANINNIHRDRANCVAFVNPLFIDSKVLIKPSQRSMDDSESHDDAATEEEEEEEDEEVEQWMPRNMFAVGSNDKRVSLW